MLTPDEVIDVIRSEFVTEDNFPEDHLTNEDRTLFGHVIHSEGSFASEEDIRIFLFGFNDEGEDCPELQEELVKKHPLLSDVVNSIYGDGSWDE